MYMFAKLIRLQQLTEKKSIKRMIKKENIHLTCHLTVIHNKGGHWQISWFDFTFLKHVNYSAKNMRVKTIWMTMILIVIHVFFSFCQLQTSLNTLFGALLQHVQWQSRYTNRQRVGSLLYLFESIQPHKITLWKQSNHQMQCWLS